MGKVFAVLNKYSDYSRKDKIAGSAFWLVALAIVFLVVLDPVQTGSSIDSRDGLAMNNEQADDPHGPRPELVAVAAKTQRLIDSQELSEGQVAAPADETASEPVRESHIQQPADKPETAAASVSKPAAPEVESQPKVEKAAEKPVEKPKTVQKPQVAAAGFSNSSTQQGWFVQVGAFKSYTNAEMLEVAARNSGYDTRLRNSGAGQDSIVKLLIGPYSTKTIATTVKTKLERSDFGKKHGIEGMFVVQSELKT